MLSRISTEYGTFYQRTPQRLAKQSFVMLNERLCYDFAFDFPVSSNAHYSRQTSLIRSNFELFS